MKAIIVMYDSLNRHYLPPYGNRWVKAPNFERLAERTAVFDTAYAGSLPTIPCRREWHTGRYNFLHRGWGPVEPFDDSMPQLLKQAGIHTRLVSDGYHYWEDGGSTYHLRYSSWTFNRGQEGEPWHADLRPIDLRPTAGREDRHRQEMINRRFMAEEADFPQTRTFNDGLDFLRTNHACDQWLLQIETFDPHEPFYSPQRYKDLYPHAYNGAMLDWPKGGRDAVPAEATEHVRCEYAALVSFCDAGLGRVLDAMDAFDLWRDTLLIVTTDHGFMLGEHGWWGKMSMPILEEVAHLPLFIWDPRCAVRGERRKTLVQTIDLPATLLEYFGQPLPPAMHGRPLRETVAADAPVREAALYGRHGGQVAVTDGRFVYLRSPVRAANEPLFNYTLFPVRMRGFLELADLRQAELAAPFTFTKGCPLLKVPVRNPLSLDDHPTVLYNLRDDPAQERPIDAAAAEARMVETMTRLMRETDAPPEQYARLGLDGSRGERGRGWARTHADEGEPGMDRPLADPRDAGGPFGALMGEMRACKEAGTCNALTSRAYYFEPNPVTTAEWQAEGLYRGPIDRRVAFVAESPGPQFTSGATAPSRCWAKTRQDNRFRELRKKYGFLDCYLTNVVKCGVRPGPCHAECELAACRRFLVRELNLVQPLIVIALGGNAYRTLKKDVMPLLDFKPRLRPTTHYSARRDVWARWRSEFEEVLEVLRRLETSQKPGAV